MFSIADSFIIPVNSPSDDVESPPVVLDMPFRYPKAIVLDCQSLNKDHIREVAQWILQRKNQDLSGTIECLHSGSVRNYLEMIIQHDNDLDNICKEIRKMCKNGNSLLRSHELSLCDVGERQRYEVHFVTNSKLKITPGYYPCINSFKIPVLYIWTDIMFEGFMRKREKWWNSRTMKIGKISDLQR